MSQVPNWGFRQEAIDWLYKPAQLTTMGDLLILIAFYTYLKILSK